MLSYWRNAPDFVEPSTPEKLREAIEF